MTCIFLPPFLKVNFAAQTPNIILQGKPYSESSMEEIQDGDHLSRTYSSSHDFFNIWDNKISLNKTKEESFPPQGRLGSEISLPTYTRGIYLSNSTGSSVEKIRNFISQAERYGLNTFVIDVQKKNDRQRNCGYGKRSGYFPRSPGRCI